MRWRCLRFQLLANIAILLPNCGGVAFASEKQWTRRVHWEWKMQTHDELCFVIENEINLPNQVACDWIENLKYCLVDRICLPGTGTEWIFELNYRIVSLAPSMVKIPIRLLFDDYYCHSMMSVHILFVFSSLVGNVLRSTAIPIILRLLWKPFRLKMDPK